MIYSVRGNLILMDAGFAVVECGGVGYRVQTSITTQKQLKLNTETMLYTYMNVREDAMELFGFYSRSELRCFKLLIGVSGVGPKAALAILSSNTPENLTMAIVTENEKALTAVPGIGKKIAQRVILELKDKLAKAEDELSFSGVSGAAMPAAVQGDKAKEAAAALSVLGYGPAEINMALKGVDMASLTLEEIIRQALKHMVK